MTKTRVDAYIRVSKVDGRRGDAFLSPEFQRQSIEDLAAREELVVVKWFEELDRSGGDASRPLWNAAIERVERGVTEGLAVWSLNRFSRSLKDAVVTLERIESAGGALYSASESLDDSPAGRLTRNFFFAIAQMERERARDGFKASVESAIERGIHISPRVPFGYLRGEDRRYHPDPETAAHVVALFENRVKGMSWSELARWSAAQGFPVSREGLRSRLGNTAYLGWARAGEIVNRNAHEPLVSRRLFNQVQDKRSSSSRNGTWQAMTLLSGIAVCAGCGRRMTVFNSRYKDATTGTLRKEPAYYCRGLSVAGECPDRACIRASTLDAYVEQRVLGYLEVVPAIHRERGEDTPARLELAERTLQTTEGDLRDFAMDTNARRVMGATLWNESLEAYAAAVEAARKEAETVRAEESFEDVELPVREVWDGWTLERRRAFLGRMLESVTVTNARRQRNLPVADRVRIKVVGSRSGGFLKLYGEDSDHWSAYAVTGRTR